MIIQCPNCQTKFSVSSELISELDMPRYHCSRCDFVFDTDMKTKSSFEIRDVSNQEVENSVKSLIESATKGSTIEEAPKATVNLTEGPVFSSTAAPNLTASTSASTGTPPRSLQIPKEFDPNILPSAPYETRTPKEYEQMTMDLPNADLPTGDLPSGDLMAGFKSEEQSNQNLPYGISIGKSLTENAEAIKVENVVNNAFNISDYDRSVFNAHKHDSGTMELSTLQMNPQDLESAQRITGTRGVMVFVAPMIVTFIGLLIFSYILIESPSMAQAFARSLSISSPKFAPAGMRLESIKYGKVILDSGEIVPVISGKIKNDSTESFKEVLIEGLAFNAKSQLLASTAINAGSSLADVRMKSLPLDMLKSLQSAKPAKKYEIAPGSSQDFTIALVGNEGASLPDLSKATYFSARIYSVRN